MRILIAALLATASILSPINGWAQSVDVEATIRSVDGLKAGVKVVVFYTVVDGNRVVDDLEIVQ
jgi:5-enolpyruvylshikimate-3-phosphate synthase